MKRKKLFVAPRVIKEVPVQLEGDLLVRSTELDEEVFTSGIESEDLNVGDEIYDVLID